MCIKAWTINFSFLEEFNVNLVTYVNYFVLCLQLKLIAKLIAKLIVKLISKLIAKLIANELFLN
jgi:hypothetical protein